MFFFLWLFFVSLQNVYWNRDFNVPWVVFGHIQSLSKTTKLILLDSLLQEVCITARINAFLSHNPSLYSGLKTVHLKWSVWPPRKAPLCHCCRFLYPAFLTPHPLLSLLCNKMLFSLSLVFVLLQNEAKKLISLSTAISCWKHQFSSDHWS